MWVGQCQIDKIIDHQYISRDFPSNCLWFVSNFGRDIMFTCIKRYLVQSFCCGCKLRTGCVIIGIVEFLFALVQVALLIILPVMHDDRNMYIVGQAVFCIFTFFISISLLIAARKNEKKFLIPWLVLKEISCVAGTIVIGILFLIALIDGQYMLCVLGIGLIVVLGIFYYFWNCIWSYYLELDSEDNYIQPLV